MQISTISLYENLTQQLVTVEENLCLSFWASRLEIKVHSLKLIKSKNREHRLVFAACIHIKVG